MPSNYMKPKAESIKELDAADPKTQKDMQEMNPIDRVMRKQQDAEDASKGITQRIKNIFDF